MPEIVSEPVTPVMLRLFCDCGREMEPENICLPVNPPRYSYVCASCGEKCTKRDQYPRIFYKPQNTTDK